MRGGRGSESLGTPEREEREHFARNPADVFGTPARFALMRSRSLQDGSTATSAHPPAPLLPSGSAHGWGSRSPEKGLSRRAAIN